MAGKGCVWVNMVWRACGCRVFLSYDPMRTGQRVSRLAVRHGCLPCSNGRHEWQRKSIDVRSCVGCGISRIRVRAAGGSRFAYADARLPSCVRGHADKVTDVRIHARCAGRYLQARPVAGLLES